MSLTTIIDTHTTEGSIVAPTEQVDRALQAIVAKPKRSSKKQKDPNAPKRPMGTYMLWLADNRQRIVEEHCSNLEGREKVTAVTRKAGEIWKTLNMFKPLQYISSSKTGGIFMKIGYNVFVKARPFLPRKEKCETDKCYR